MLEILLATAISTVELPPNGSRCFYEETKDNVITQRVAIVIKPAMYDPGHVIVKIDDRFFVADLKLLDCSKVDRIDG